MGYFTVIVRIKQRGGDRDNSLGAISARMGRLGILGYRKNAPRRVSGHDGAKCRAMDWPKSVGFSAAEDRACGSVRCRLAWIIHGSVATFASIRTGLLTGDVA